MTINLPKSSKWSRYLKYLKYLKMPYLISYLKP